MPTHKHPRVRGFFYLGPCSNVVKDIYPNGLHHRDCNSYGDETSCDYDSATNACTCVHVNPPPPGDDEQLIFREFIYEFEDDIKFLVDQLGPEDSNHWVPIPEANYSDPQFRFGYVVGTLVASIELRFYDKYGRSPVSEEQQEIAKLISVEAPRIRRKLSCE